MTVADSIETFAVRAKEIIDSLRQVWSGRQVGILAPRLDRSTANLVSQLYSVGAEIKLQVLALGPSENWSSSYPLWIAEEHSGVALDRMSFEKYLRFPPQSLSDWLDKLDPARKLTLLGGVYTEVPEVCGRRVYGWRRPKWAAWEDKTTIDSLLAEAGVSTPRHVVTEIGDPKLLSCLRSVDHGHGAILAIDSSQVYSGNSNGLRWVRNSQELSFALTELGHLSRSVRLSTYVEGIPTSILGLVTFDGVAVFDPLEVATLRDRRSGRMLFCGTSNYWRPPLHQRQNMRESTRRVGVELARQAQYVGFFSLDGIVTSEGFLATEVNPRHASGLGLSAAWPWFPDYLFHRSLQEREPQIWHVPSSWVEEAFRASISCAPSFRLSVPTSEIEFVAARMSRIQIGDITHDVQYESKSGSAEIRFISPRPNLVGPLLARLARNFTSEPWESPVEFVSQEI